MVYPPAQEKEYLTRVKKDYSEEYIINISRLFVDLVDSFGLEIFKEMYRNFRSTPDQVFADEDSPEDDLYSYILKEIKTAIKQNKMPVLIRTGILYGTGIRNKKILESEVVSQMKKPLIIFYPGSIKEDIEDKEVIYFLGEKKASDYRGQFI
ncbi:MAG: hypothetical protein ACOCZT_01120 [Halanaerobiales bacterium]